MALYTDMKVSIDGRVKEGKTLFFSDKSVAVATAKRMRSYCYEVFNGFGFTAGWAVPK